MIFRVFHTCVQLNLVMQDFEMTVTLKPINAMIGIDVF